MKAEDIRELNRKLQDEGLKTESIGAQDAGLKSLACSLLAEIAAQLAEVKEFLEIYTNPPMVFGGTDIDPAALDDALQNLPQPILTVMEPRLTLRDRFAMAAMTGMLAYHGTNNSYTEEWWAKHAYKQADAMLEARNEKR
jgi:hypothetical protein